MSGGQYEVRVMDGEHEFVTGYGNDGIKATIGFMRLVVLPNRTGSIVLTDGLPGMEEEVLETHEHDPSATPAHVHGRSPAKPEPPMSGTYHSHCLLYAIGYIDALGPLSPFSRSDGRKFADHCAVTPAVGATISERWVAWSEATREARGT